MLSALITGTSTGIGLETALLFARRGFRVYAGARNPAASEGLQRALADGLFLTPIALDVDREESVRQALAQAGSVDVLVNNAGIASSAAVELMPMEEIRALFETNVFGAVRMMQAVLAFPAPNVVLGRSSTSRRLRGASHSRATATTPPRSPPSQPSPRRWPYRHIRTGPAVAT
jgi:NAD(P)-dependent dehydrogenase (short-subunit alcohol dehydrogenase family)